MVKKIVTQLAKLTAVIFILIALGILGTSKFENPWGIRSFVVLTGSMQPTISQGSILFTQKINHYKKGNIVAFHKNNVTVTHRITETKGSSFTTQGDANNTPDNGSITSKEILGRHAFAVPYVGNVILFMRSLPGFIVLIIVPAFMYIAFEILTIKRELEKHYKSKYQQSTA